MLALPGHKCEFRKSEEHEHDAAGHPGVNSGRKSNTESFYNFFLEINLNSIWNRIRFDIADNRCAISDGCKHGREGKECRHCNANTGLHISRRKKET